MPLFFPPTQMGAELDLLLLIFLSISLFSLIPVIQVFNFSFILTFFPFALYLTVSKSCHIHYQNVFYTNLFLFEKFIYINIWFYFTYQLTRLLN